MKLQSFIVAADVLADPDTGSVVVVSPLVRIAIPKPTDARPSPLRWVSMIGFTRDSGETDPIHARLEWTNPTGAVIGTSEFDVESTAMLHRHIERRIGLAVTDAGLYTVTLSASVGDGPRVRLASQIVAIELMSELAT